MPHHDGIHPAQVGQVKDLFGGMAHPHLKIRFNTSGGGFRPHLRETGLKVFGGVLQRSLQHDIDRRLRRPGDGDYAQRRLIRGGHVHFFVLPLRSLRRTHRHTIPTTGRSVSGQEQEIVTPFLRLQIGLQFEAIMIEFLTEIRKRGDRFGQ